METFIKFGKVENTEHKTNVVTAEVYDAHPAHDGKIQFYLSFILTSDDSDLYFERVSATPFFTDNDTIKTRTGTYIDPYHLKKALEMVWEHMYDGKVTVIEEGMLMCEEHVWIN